jgi:hypothetical protein
VIRAFVSAVALVVALAPGSAVAAATTVRVSVEPASAGVGDPLVVRVDVTPPDGVDPAEVGVELDPGPLTALSPPTTERRGSTVHMSQTLACLSTDCAPGAHARTVTVPAARVRVAGRPMVVAPLRVRLVPRVPAAALRRADPPFRRTTAAPDPSFRLAPNALVAVLVAIAGALVVLAVVLVVTSVRRRPAQGAAVDPVARALRLLRESVGRSVSDRRRAAGLASRVLAERGARPLADQAGGVAWSPPPPEPAAAETLAERIAATVETGPR